ncbi:hypothetical protein Tco_1397826 [Tanacetum coccineum]
MLVSTSIIFSSANSTEYLVSTVDGMMSLKGKILAEVRLLSTRFHVLTIIASVDLTSCLSEVSSVQEFHNLRDSNSRKGFSIHDLGRLGKLKISSQSIQGNMHRLHTFLPPD